MALKTSYVTAMGPGLQMTGALLNIVLFSSPRSPYAAKAVCKNSKNLDTRKFAVIILKFEQHGFIIE